MKPWPQKALSAADEELRKAPPRPLRPSLRRFSWSRLHADVLSSDLWGLVAETAKTSRDRVEAFVARLDVYASGNQPRGSVEGFPLRALAVTWRCDAEELARIYAALEDPEIGWLDQDHVVTFWERNPDQEDPTAAERMRRHRARKKNAQLQAQRRAEKESFPQVESVTRNTVTVTTRSDHTYIGGKAGATAPPGPSEAPQAVQRDSGDSGIYLTAAESAEVWLSTDGLKLVIERGECLSAVAQMRIGRWRTALGGDPIVLREIFAGLSLTGFRSGRFLTLVDDEIARRKHLAQGPPLPLGPAIATGRRTGNG